MLSSTGGAGTCYSPDSVPSSSLLELLPALLRSAPALASGLLLRSVPFLAFAIVGRALGFAVRAVALAIGVALAVGLYVSTGPVLRDIEYAPLGFAWLALWAAVSSQARPARFSVRLARHGAGFALAASRLHARPAPRASCFPGVASRLALGFLVTFRMGGDAARSQLCRLRRFGPHHSIAGRGALLALRPSQRRLRGGEAFASRRPTGHSPRAPAHAGRGGRGHDRTGSPRSSSRPPPTAFAGEWSDVERIRGVSGVPLVFGSRPTSPWRPGLYCAHSGLASFHIGWMRLFGHELPERYRYPMFATSSAGFWHRWNTWSWKWTRALPLRPHILDRRRPASSAGRSAPTWRTASSRSRASACSTDFRRLDRARHRRRLPRFAAPHAHLRAVRGDPRRLASRGERAWAAPYSGGARSSGAPPGGPSPFS